MVDFSKLLNRTPEEREAALRRSAEEFEARQAARHVEMIRQLEAIQSLPNLSEWEKGFVATMVSISQQHDPASGVVGRALVYLSDSRAKTFQDLAARAARQTVRREAPRGGA